MGKTIVDITSQVLHELDYEEHATRGEHWGKELTADYEKRTRFTERYFRNNHNADVFRIARAVHLPIMTVREIAAKVKKEKGAK